MKKIIYLLLIFPLFISISSNGDDEISVDTHINMIARKDISGNNTISAIFYIFKSDNYDPESFSRVDQFSSIATLKNNQGKVIESIDFKVSNENNGYITYNCAPGNYFIVCCPSGFIPNTILLMNLWKANEIQVDKNKGVAFEVKFKSLYSKGYVRWDE